MLSPIEQRIKKKIEEMGTPLKDWDVSINYGIKTGYNDAFIISEEKKNELIENSPESAEIIRPILRGRDIKKFKVHSSGLWLINVHNGVKEKGVPPIDIDSYPAIKSHLKKYIKPLEKRADKGITPFHLRNCAYMEEFSKPKLIYPDIMRMPGQKRLLKEYPYFYYDENNNYAEATNFIMTGENIDLIYLFLTSDLGFFAFSKFYTGPQFDATGFRYKKAYLEKTVIPKPNDEQASVLRNILKNKMYQVNIHNEINAIWADIVGLGDKEVELIEAYKKNLINTV